MSSDAAEFAVLVARARAGDADALDRLARQYEPDLRVVARLRLGSALRPYLDSIDLVQSVHKSLLRGLQQDKFEIDRPEQLVALALTMVRRKATRAWRKAQRQVRHDDISASAPLAGILVNLSSPGSDPAKGATYRDTVEAACRALDATERRLLELHLQGYRTVEIAEQLGLNADVLRVKLSRLKAKLRAGGVLADEL